MTFNEFAAKVREQVQQEVPCPAVTLSPAVWDAEVQRRHDQVNAEVARRIAQTAIEACARFVEGGSFLHTESPQARMAKECAKALRAMGIDQIGKE